MASNASVPSRGLPAKPPDKGSFLLDHFRECSEMKEQYMACLKADAMRADGAECRKLSAAYLQCRMDRELMAKEELTKLGIHGDERRGGGDAPDRQRRERGGFVAGVPDNK